jgi:hypothetical protein
MADHVDGEGSEKFITNEGAPIKDPASKAKVLFRKVQRFQLCLLDVGN